MAIRLPPAPKATHEIKQIYPWDEYSLQWLFTQLKRIGYTGDYEDFKKSYEELTPLITVYEGQYTVTPMAEVDQILRTKDTHMGDNVVVEKIPYYETTNDAGGYTVIIG